MFKRSVNPEPPEHSEDECSALSGLKVVERTSWGITDTVVLRGPASTDEEGERVGPGDIEVKISSPGRMGLGAWFSDEAKYDLEFIEGRLAGRELPRGLLIPHAEVVEKTRWGLSITSRLQADVGQGKVVEVKVSIPWPEENLLEEGQLYAIAIEPLAPQTEGAEPQEQERPDTFLRNWLWNDMEDLARIKGTFGAELTQECFDEALHPPTFQDRIKEAVRRAREYDRLHPYRTSVVYLDEAPDPPLEKLLLRPRRYVSRAVVEGVARIQDAINAWEYDDADDE